MPPWGRWKEEAVAWFWVCPRGDGKRNEGRRWVGSRMSNAKEKQKCLGRGGLLAAYGGHLHLI